MPAAPTEITRRLEALAERRRERKQDDKDLAADITAAVKSAQKAMPMTEIARLLDIDRSTIYRVYLTDGG